MMIMSKKEGTFGNFVFIAVTVLVLFVVKGWLLDAVVYSLCCSLLGGENLLSALASYLLSYVLIGVLATLPLYWRMRDNSTDKRRFLAFFAENDYNPENRKKYMQFFRSEKTVFAVALAVAMLVEEFGALLLSPGYVLVVIAGYAVIFATYLLFCHFARVKLYDNWYAERLHRR